MWPQQKVVYGYDAFNNLISRDLDSNDDGTVDQSGYFIYDNGQILLQLDSTGEVDKRLLWGSAVDQILADENGSGDVYWMLTDRNRPGNPIFPPVIAWSPSQAFHGSSENRHGEGTAAGCFEGAAVAGFDFWSGCQRALGAGLVFAAGRFRSFVLCLEAGVGSAG
ncbi:hypothetical protein M4951_22840 [Blastopirellula sp. J2-11]|uniref:hypothetical protein n=1 Tax=Blastopirellula sp. J2-11 TaxID=2943192 RepID=UPI0021CABBB1|nr:hypothetical protein [Blastopirellula sp. J2-11]UUO06181.1 hypothetical protein M4951_22840 [Blastopirellula sp. J2-11]